MIDKINRFINYNDSRRYILLLSLLFIFILVVAISVSFAKTVPVRSIEITSKNSDFSKGEAGSWKVTKSAKWVSEKKARITFAVDSVIKTKRKYTDVILVVDTSGSMNEEKKVSGVLKTKLSKVQEDCENLIRLNLNDKNNHIALINFDTDSNIVSDFTNDKELLVNRLKSLQATGNTNYYQALVNVDSILSNYQGDSDHDLVVLFLTDGYPNVDASNNLSQYNYLKKKYPNLIINGVLYDIGDVVSSQFSEITDKQFTADNDTLWDFLYLASVPSVPYDSFSITDYIDSDYFEVDSDSINCSNGTATLDASKNTPIVTWNLDNVSSGLKSEMTIDISLKKNISNDEKLYYTNKSTTVKSRLGDISENVTTTNTPILADNYMVIYDGNSPGNCTVTNVPTNTSKSVFNIVKISNNIPTCAGYKFKNWEIITSNVETVGSDSFKMPEANVTIRATWTSLGLDKTMDGKLSVVQTLYKMMADNSVMDNVSSEYVTSTKGIDFSKVSSDTNGKGIYELASSSNDIYPIYYYRGDINNNNVIFANFCWKIVRTTDTGGVKMIFNGNPGADGSCTAIGAAARARTSGYGDSNSMAFSGYMYGNVYQQNTMSGSIVGLGGMAEKNISDIKTSNYIYANDVTYDTTTGLYTLIDGKNKIWNDTFAVDIGNQYLYTCLSDSTNTCSTVYYITRSNEANVIYYVEFTDGNIADTLMNKNIVYGNDVTYDTTTGLYTLTNTFTSKIKDYKTDYITIAGKGAAGYHYTCLSSDSSCSEVKYIYYVDNYVNRSISNFYFVKMSAGKKIDDLIEEMTTGSGNTRSSNLKNNTESWYESNLLDYTEKLEDTVWCNDRAIGSYNGWSKDGDATKWLVFKAGYNLDNSKPSLECSNMIFKYTVSSTSGNQKLKYPIALLTADEVTYAGGRVWKLNKNFYLYSNSYWWTMTPYYVGGLYGTNAFNLYSNGDLDTSPLYYGRDLRPAISLKKGTIAVDGDGTPSSPYIVQ